MTFMKNWFESLYTDRQTNYRLFDAEQPAQDWVTDCLARARHPAGK